MRDRKDTRVARRALRGFLSVIDPRAFFHLFRLLHYYNHTHVAERRKLRAGQGLRLAPNVSLANAERIEIGDHVQIGARCALWAGDNSGRITIGSHATFGPDCFLTASDYRLGAGKPVTGQPTAERDITVGPGVWLGARAIVTAGVVIGDGAVVGAGAVVTRDLPADCIAAGVPAKVIRMRA